MVSVWQEVEIRHGYLGVFVACEVSVVLSDGIVPLIGAWIIATVTAADGGAILC